MEKKKDDKLIRVLNRILLVLFILDLIGLGVGYYIQKFGEDIALGIRVTGFSVLGLFAVIMPLFLFIRFRHRDMNKYLLTKENMDKMREERDGRKI